TESGASKRDFKTFLLLTPNSSLPARAAREHDAVAHLDRHGGEELTAGGAGDAFAAGRFVGRAGRGALDVCAGFAEELILHPVHGHWDVATAIQVRVEGAAVVDQKRLELAATAGQHELLRPARRQLIGARHGDRRGRGIGSHARLHSSGGTANGSGGPALRPNTKLVWEPHNPLPRRAFS